MRYSGKLHLFIQLLLITMVFIGGCGVREQVIVEEMPYEKRLSLAKSYYEAGEDKNAVVLLNEAVAQDSLRPEAHSMLGDIYYRSENMTEAALEYRRAVERGDSDPVVLNNLAWVETSLGHHGAALSLVEKAIEMAPVPLYPYLDTRARIFRSMGNIKEARISAEMALRLTPVQDIGMRRNLEDFLDELAVLEEPGDLF
jgi:Tfp pilus assembly protein PilF